MTTAPQNTNQLPDAVLQPLREHVDYVAGSSDAYDAGFASEITRCAQALSALFYSPAPFLSLLAQAHGLYGNFLSTTLPRGLDEVGRYGSLVRIAKFDGRPIYLAPLDTAWFGRWLKFGDWWNEPVFVTDEKKELSRRELVVLVAAKDGGTNVDPNLAMLYERVSARDAAKTNAKNSEALTVPECVAVRQIAHEALRTLFPTYRKFPKPDSDPRMNVALAKATEPPTSLPASPNYLRNGPCPCGSNKKLKYCHGSIK